MTNKRSKSPNNYMRRMLQWVMAATLVCGASLFTACSSNDDEPNTPVVAARSMPHPSLGLMPPASIGKMN
jgi:hypothetical protein